MRKKIMTRQDKESGIQEFTKAFLFFERTDSPQGRNE
jgi:hypothetical protein